MYNRHVKLTGDRLHLAYLNSCGDLQFGGSWCSRAGIVTCFGLDGLGSNAGRDRKCPDFSGAYPASFSMGARIHGQGMKLTTHLHLVPRLSMSGAVPLLPIYAFIAWTGKILTFCINFNEFIQWGVTIPRGIFLFTH